MGIKILSPMTCKFGISLPTSYISFLGNYTIVKQRGFKPNELTGQFIPSFSYRVSALAQLWSNKEAVENLQPLGDVLIDIIVKQEDLDKNILKDILYPALLEKINIDGTLQYEID